MTSFNFHRGNSWLLSLFLHFVNLKLKEYRISNVWLYWNWGVIIKHFCTHFLTLAIGTFFKEILYWRLLLLFLFTLKNNHILRMLCSWWDQVFLLLGRNNMLLVLINWSLLNPRGKEIEDNQRIFFLCHRKLHICNLIRT